MTNNIIEFGLFSFVSIITMLNPVSTIPIFVSITSELSDRESKIIAIRASLVALLALLFFAVSGKLIFDFFSISVDSLRIVGGMIFFLVGYEMFHARMPKMKYDEEMETENVYDQAITPIGIPLICGPGSITTVMLLMKESDTILYKSVLFATIIGAIGVTMLLLLSSKKIMVIIGNTGKKVLMRIMGLLVMVIAVDLFFKGVKSILQEIFCL